MNRIKKSAGLIWSVFLLSLTVFLLGSLRPGAAQPEPDWKQKWERHLSEARKEGKVVVWGPPGELIRDAMVEGFSRAFPGITVEYSGGRGGEKATRLKAERDAGIYSVDLFLTGNLTGLLQLKPMGALDPVRPALVLPEVTDLKSWREQRLGFADKTGMYNLAFVEQAKAQLVYNTKDVKADEVDELYELLDPKWKGKFVINDPLPTGASHGSFRWLWHILGPGKATDYYRRLRAQAGVVDRDQRRQIEWVAQGKYAFLLSPSDGVLEQLMQRGLKIGIMAEFKDYGTFTTTSFGSAMLINKAPHPNAAKVFLNWLLGKEGQTAWSKAMNHSSRRLDIPTDHLPPYTVPKPGVKYWLNDMEENASRTPEEEKILEELFGR